jgi:broad specificity phosphatase PhoE
MGQILLVRHGQASWGADDYDVLSPTGEEQSAVLGRALAGVEPGEVVHGVMQRPRRTAELVAEAAGWSAPFREDPRWNEMDHLAILAAHPREGGSDPGGEPDRVQFQAWFEAATDRWTSGGFDDEYAESFPVFRARVAAALADLVGSSAEGTTVVVTSGGPISAVTVDLLDAGTPTYTRLAPVVVNTSVTRLVTGRRGLTLVSFNEHTHLQGRDGLLTYR